ncbi:MAG: DUF1801 domain-containing protein [Gammaproteobacteria bacterium]
MPKRKTNATQASVQDFVNTIDDEVKRDDCQQLVDLFAKATRQKPIMWGDKIVGYGKHHYAYADGSPAEICKVGFAPRARSFAFYLAKFPERENYLAKLGKHKFSGGCLHITRLADVDLAVLNDIVKLSYQHRKSEQPN